MLSLEIACKLKKIFPRISTRGFYDLDSGTTLQNESYNVYPKRMFDALVGTKEITIMIHGLRNNAAGALTKFITARRRLAALGYKHPVIGYSYDSNTVGAQYISYALHALHIGVIIANKNGRNLAKFVEDFKPWIEFCVGIKGSADLESAKIVADKLKLNLVSKEFEIEEIEDLLVKTINILPTPKIQNDNYIEYMVALSRYSTLSSLSKYTTTAFDI